MTDVSAGGPRPKIPVWRTAYDAYRLGLGAVFSSGVMFRFFVYGSLLCLATLSGYFYIVGDGQSDALVSIGSRRATAVVVITVTYLLLAAVAAPLGICIQRYIVLGEPPRKSYFHYAAMKRGRSYVFASLAVSTVFLATALVQMFADEAIFRINATTLDEAFETPRFTSAMMVLAFNLFTYGIAALLVVRFSFAFPAIACDRPGASLRQSMSETRGSLWRLFFVPLIVSIPYGIVSSAVLVVASSFAAYNYIGSEGFVPTPEELYSILMSSSSFFAGLGIVFVGAMIIFIAIAAGAARAYQIRIERGLSGVAEVFS